MKHLISFIAVCVFSFVTVVHANDGVFYLSGNQLIPMTENNIRVKKEILNIKHIGDNLVEVNVYYEFDNPGLEKELIVGFEAAAPSGDVEDWRKTTGHPFIYRFSVLMNGAYLSYNVATVNDSHYYKNGKIVGRSLEELDTESDYPDFTYVYHFKAAFKKGINRITHSYICKMSSSVDTRYNFTYILSAACRWGNKQIDDFTLNIDMGSFEYFRIQKTFYEIENEWKILGKGKIINTGKTLYEEETKSSSFFMQSGTACFQKSNFKPDNELYLYGNRGWFATEWLHPNDTFDYKIHNLPFCIESDNLLARDEFSLKVLKNLPFARRGYIFKNPELQKWFEKQVWYMPDPGYHADLDLLSESEKAWLQLLRIAGN